MFVRILLHQMEEEKLMTQEELEFRRRCPNQISFTILNDLFL